MDIEKNIEQSRETLRNFEEKMKVINEEKWKQLLLKVIIQIKKFNLKYLN